MGNYPFKEVLAVRIILHLIAFSATNNLKNNDAKTVDIYLY